MNKNIVSLKNVSLTLDSKKPVLNNISLFLEAHHSLTLIGHNGAGKSSLLKLLVGDLHPDQGVVQLLGQNISKEMDKDTLRKLRSQIGFIHQGLHLVGRKSVLENVLMGRLAHNQSVKTWFNIFNSADYDIAYEALKDVKLQDKAMLRADHLSGGERQKTAIARALAQSPALILADEPTAALDPRASHEVAGLLKNLVEEKHLALITVVHSLELLDKISERLVVMKKGEILFDGNQKNITPDIFKTFYQE
ncbi:MAG: ATP-binding cassette domain-containing protein [Rhizobacter sp.]|nr:ATP-binding cassette domain-containing protein [Bacteriovorax sp.]